MLLIPLPFPLIFIVLPRVLLLFIEFHHSIYQLDLLILLLVPLITYSFFLNQYSGYDSSQLELFHREVYQSNLEFVTIIDLLFFLNLQVTIRDHQFYPLILQPPIIHPLFRLHLRPFLLLFIAIIAKPLEQQLELLLFHHSIMRFGH